MSELSYVQLAQNGEVLEIADQAARNSINNLHFTSREFTNVVMIGDSYLGNGWGNSLNTLMGWSNSRQYANAAAGFIASGVVYSGNYTDMISNSDGPVRTGEASTHNDVDLVVCVGGVNDSSTVSRTTYIQAVESFIYAAKAYFPNAQIAVFPSWLGRPMSIAIWAGICGAATELQCITARSDRWLFNWFYDFSDNTHPGSTASLVAVQSLATCLKGFTPETRYTVRQVAQDGLTGYYWFDQTFCNMYISGTRSVTNQSNLFTSLPYNFRPLYYAAAGSLNLPGFGVYSAYLTGGDNTNAILVVDGLGSTVNFNNAFFQVPIDQLEMSTYNLAGE